MMYLAVHIGHASNPLVIVAGKKRSFNFHWTLQCGYFKFFVPENQESSIATFNWALSHTFDSRIFEMVKGKKLFRFQ